MEVLLRQKLQDGYGARLTARYCWPWSDPRQDGTPVDDVRIGDWAKPWNLKIYSVDPETRDHLRQFVAADQDAAAVTSASWKATTI